MKKLIFIFTVFVTALAFFTGCQQGINMGSQGGDNPNSGQQDGWQSGRQWTIIIYMAADNDLEAAAIANMNQLEAVRFGNAPISILVLMDRPPGSSTAGNNWGGTRLFEVRSDPNGWTGTIISPRLDSMELGLTRYTDVNLNMADPLVLSRLLDFAKRAYPADNYALIMWGHGTGRAFAIDDTSGQYMSLPALGRAISGKGISLLGFDTCYGGLLEVAYQVRNDATLLVGSQTEILSTGWDYTALFNDFLSRPDLSISDFANAIQSQFSTKYATFHNTAISQILLSQVDNLFSRFNNFARTLAEAITTQASRDAVLHELLHSVESHFFTPFPSDKFIDIYDFSQKITAIRTAITSDTIQQDAIAAAAVELQIALAAAVPSSWAQNGTTNKLGVHLIPLQGFAVPAARHHLSYIRGSPVIERSAFVQDSQHWVPNWTPQSNSFLDKLFYWIF